MPLMRSWPILALFLSTLFIHTPQDSKSAAFVVWVLRIITFSLLFRSFLAPTILRLVSKRLRVQSVSLRSIRGIYFRAGKGILHIDRVGLSYHRPSELGASRFSIRVEGFRLELVKPDQNSRNSKAKADDGSRKRALQAATRTWSAARSITTTVYTTLEPYLRPVLRKIVVSGLRIMIRALPALTQVLDLEIDSAVVTSPTVVPGAEVVVSKAKIHTSVAFTQLDNSQLRPTNLAAVVEQAQAQARAKARHRRFASVADLNTRIKNSFRRTWDRAWGSTHVAASLLLDVRGVSCVASRALLEEVKGPLSDVLHKQTFVSIPDIKFSTSVHLDPRQRIERHGLEVSFSAGAASLDVDIVQYLLAILKKLKKTKAEDVVELPASPPPFSSPMRSPPLSPRASRIGWASPMSPGSPLMEALSARFRWTYRQQAKRIHSMSRTTGLSIVKSIRLEFTSLTLTHSSHSKDNLSAGTYRASLDKIALSATLSHPDRVPLHREWLGRTSAPGDPLTADVYAVGFSVKQLCLDRVSKEHVEDYLRIVRLGPIDIATLTSQWPSPWLQGSLFLSGDPNAQFLVVRISLGTLEVTERLEVIQELLRQKKPEPQSTVAEQFELLPPVLSPIPRLAVGVHIGAVYLKLISAGTQECNPFSLEARTEGFAASLDTHFQILPDSRASRPYTDPDRPRLQMSISLHGELQRTFINVNMSQECLLDDPHGAFGGAAYPGEPVFSLDTVQLTGSGYALGEMADEVGGGVMIDIPSAYLDSQCSSDALSVELWQPDAIASLRAVITAFQNDKPVQSPEPGPPKYLLSQLPSGLSVSLALSRVMLFVTSPDLAPEEDLNISRGVAYHMGASLHYCSIRERQLVGFSELLARTQKRHQLSLPPELAATAAGGSGASTISQSERAFLQVKVWDAAFRDALSTRFVADDPFGIGDLSEDYRSKEYLRIDQITAGIVLSGKRSSGLPLPSSKIDCAVSVAVSHVRGYIHLAHAYNLLLAAHALKSVVPRRTQTEEVTPAPKLPSTLNVVVQCDVERVQLVWEFPLRMKLYTRIADLSVNRPVSGIINLGWHSIILAVPVDIERDGATRKTWEELGRLMNWNLQIRPDTSPVQIVARADSARVRIPFDYVIADLILDIVLSMKSMKHLVHMVPTGRFSNPLTPEAEDAKKMPDLTLRIGRLIVDAADDNFETRLGNIWRAGFEAARLRLERDDAFEAKANTILSARREDPATPAHDGYSEFQFTPEHTISIDEARARLREVHSGAWKSHIRQATMQQARRQLHKETTSKIPPYQTGEELVPVVPPPSAPPLLRLMLDGLLLHLKSPSFPLESIPQYLFREGAGLPLDTEYSLLVPMHLTFSVSSLRVDCREYPLPMLNIPAHSNKETPGLVFDSDVVIAEEMGTEHSVEWIDCAIVKPHTGVHGASPLYIAVPKTIMAVKSYANPVIRVKTDDVTDFAWGVSYGPATQDIMRVVDTLSHAPRDSSPPIGFWDKLRLIFHWQLRVFFDSDVHLHMKGSNDPHGLGGDGAGFALCWEGNPQLLIGQKNDQNELIQMISDSMSIIIPNIEYTYGTSTDRKTTGPRVKNTRARKVCAKFGSGSRFGVGFVLERSCGLECETCQGDAFHRQCRFFDFRPHYEILLERKANEPLEKSTDDSYNGFRSDFIHMSLSLTSSLHEKTGKHSSIHLSSAVFSHFWSWWSLFDTKSLPIRQGVRYKHKRPLSPKFGQHLATIKYKIDLPRLFLTHAYRDESKDAWVDGVTPFVGVKAMIGRFTADMHQRAQESTITTPTGAVKTILHKKFYAVEVVMVDLELRALMALFSDPLKQRVPIDATRLESCYRSREDIPELDGNSPWADLDDFRDPDWVPSSTPLLHALPLVFCPRFTYFKRIYTAASSTKDRVESTKFGEEQTHHCFLGKEPSIPSVQKDLAIKRIEQLRSQLATGIDPCVPNDGADAEAGVNAKHMISLLEDYVQHLRQVERESQTSSSNGPLNYYMASDSVSPDEWAEFDNVYQVHCPRIYLDNIIRDIMLQYYYCSRTRRGFEYHMATRAVKFIRDQAQEVINNLQTEVDQEKHRGAAGSAQAAAQAVKKILTGGDSGSKTSFEVTGEPLGSALHEADPMRGWSEGVSLQKGHFCVLLKPQLVLKSEANAEAVCVLAAVQGKLQTYNIMDDANVDDPVSGKVMSRNYASLMGLQAFSPSAINKTGEGVVPLEVLIDLRCASNFFDRLVPQTDAMLHYDKFNRLRLRNNANSAAVTHSDANDQLHNHLHSQNDLVRIHVPRFTISANDRHFQAISNIVTNLVLFSNVAHKTRSERLEKMLFSYDFTNLSLAADVVAKLQCRLREAVETKREAEWKLRGRGDPGEVEKLKIDAHILLLAEELDYVFEAIKLAQDKADDYAAQKSALLLHASSNEISWRMIDRHDQLLAKLAVRDIDFRWLNKQDGSTINNLAVGDLQAFDGAADTEWTEILAKYDESSSHPLAKRKLFCVASWNVLPPVGGITIYQSFELSFHPMRLQIDTKVGGRIMEYLWPTRRKRHTASGSNGANTEDEELHLPPSAAASPITPRSPLPSPSPRTPTSARRASVDIVNSKSPDLSMLSVPTLRKTATSRSFTDLRKAASDSLQVPSPSPLTRTRSTDALFTLANSNLSSQASKGSEESKERRQLSKQEADDAAVMKTRASQKTFIWVKVCSLHLMLSIRKEDSFHCRDARIRTRDLEYRNQTWSFEELVDQFIPSGKNWKGWVKIAFQQPLVPVLPVARELISKTKWVNAKAHHSDNQRRGTTSRSDTPSRQNTLIPKRLRTFSAMSRQTQPPPPPPSSMPRRNEDLTALGLVAEPDALLTDQDEDRRPQKKNLLKVFRKRSKSRPRGSFDSVSSASVRLSASDAPHPDLKHANSEPLS